MQFAGWKIKIILSLVHLCLDGRIFGLVTMLTPKSNQALISMVKLMIATFILTTNNLIRR
jgi:hypothetical protein